ncbi:MAG TPA: hypothetical protein VNU97_06640 [Rhizomicrobium sp.]|jgi:hypothetical protein|nr:hypothetical protein [Rhizomicrobium sp.]
MAASAPMFDNEFGAVYPDRIAFYAKKGWFGGGVLEELPMRHVTSVRLETSRNVFGGLVLTLIGAGFLYSGAAIAMLFGLIALALGILLLIGWPAVTINTAGNDLRTSTGGVWQKGNAESFVSAVRKALFDKP